MPPVDAPSPAAAVTPPPGRRALLAVQRVVVAHVFGYPIAFLWAVAAIPLTIHLSVGSLDRLGGDLDSVGHFVLRRLAWPAGAGFLLAHLAAIPWIRAADAALGFRRCLAVLGALMGLGVIAGGASWSWLLLR
jgi:hypothetical protein